MTARVAADRQTHMHVLMTARVAADRQTHMHVLMTARVARLAVTDKAVVSVRTLLVLRAIVVSVCTLVLC